MKTTTKYAIAAGTVIAVGGLVWLVTRDDDEKKTTGGGNGGGGGLTGTYSARPTTKLARLGTWSESRRAQAESLAAQAYTDMGAPTDFSWQNVVDVANAVATKMWPTIPWPTTVAQSDRMLLQREYGYAVWQQLFLIAQVANGYTPEVGP